jgi:hypothetical protein
MTSQMLALWGFAIIAAILLGFAAVVLWKILTCEVSLDSLLLEPPDPKFPDRPSKASLSRFQFLIFTFVIAGLFLMLSIEAGTLIDIPNNVLVLLGISGGSYLVSKGVQMSATRNELPPDQGAEASEAKRKSER